MNMITAMKAWDVSNRYVKSPVTMSVGIDDYIMDAIKETSLNKGIKCKIMITKAFHDSSTFDEIMSLFDSLGFNCKFSSNKYDMHTNYRFRGTNDEDCFCGVIIIDWEKPKKENMHKANLIYRIPRESISSFNTNIWPD